jgi:hypothetical protein
MTANDRQLRRSTPDSVEAFYIALIHAVSIGSQFSVPYRLPVWSSVVDDLRNAFATSPADVESIE